jgi:hypothetical protein
MSAMVAISFFFWKYECDEVARARMVVSCARCDVGR